MSSAFEFTQQQTSSFFFLTRSVRLPEVQLILHLATVGMNGWDLIFSKKLFPAAALYLGETDLGEF